jgi:transposase-like protein
VRLRDSLSNPTAAVRRLVSTLDRGREPGNGQFRASADDAAIAQAGAEDPTLVRTEVKENRKLTPVEVDDLASAYEAGSSMLELKRRFDVHEQTVRRQLVKRGVAIRPKNAFTDAQEREVVRLYVDEQRTLAEIAPLYEVSTGAVRKVLIRRGVERRAQARRRDK